MANQDTPSAQHLSNSLEQLSVKLKKSGMVFMLAFIVSVGTLKLLTLASFLHLPLWVCVIFNVVFPLWCVTLFRSGLCMWSLFTHIRRTPFKERAFYPTSDIIRKTEMSLAVLCFTNTSMLFPFMVYCMATRESIIYPFGLMLIVLIGSVVLSSNLMVFLSKNPKSSWFHTMGQTHHLPHHHFNHQLPSTQTDNIPDVPLENSPSMMEWQAMEHDLMNPNTPSYDDSDFTDVRTSAYEMRQLRERHSRSPYDD